MSVRTTGLVFALLALFAVSAAGADVTLRWEFRKGKSYRYVLMQQIEASMKLQDKILKTKMTDISDVTWVVTDVTPDGSAEMTWTFDRMRSKLESPSGNSEFDSSKKSSEPQVGPRATARTIAESIVGAPFAVVMTDRGDVTKVVVPEKVSAAIKAAGPAGQTFSERGIKQLIGASAMLLPEKAVSAGTTWTQKRTIELAGVCTLETDTTYTDKGEAPGMPHLRQIKGDVKLQIRQPEHAQFTVRVTSQDNASTLLFDTAAGQLSRSNGNQSMHLELLFQDRSIEQDMTTTSSMTLVDRPAAK
jgi:hypothetical protein